MYVQVFENMEGARDFVEELRKIGVQAQIPEMPFGLKLPKQFTDKPHELIEIGCSLDPRFVVPLIRLGVERWPHLKYWHLSSDHHCFIEESTHYALTLGCHTETAEKKRIRPWTEEQFAALDPQMNITDFHYLIRSSMRSEYSTTITFIGGIHDGETMRIECPAQAVTQLIHKDGFWRQHRQNEPACDIYEIRIIADDRIECHFVRTDRN